MDRQESMRNTKQNNKKDPQKKHRLGTVSKNIFTGGLKQVLWYQPHPYFRCDFRSLLFFLFNTTPSINLVRKGPFNLFIKTKGQTISGYFHILSELT